ncbi:hypothetical protein JB92DRAFT_3021616 [Gautieria morchelliformis]|nr:hypothetical protein JB92DRAFT_3021616 [Gautieria morchelliformis]
MTTPARKVNLRNSKGPSNIWRTMEPQNSPLSSHRLAAKVYTDKLDLTEAQRRQIDKIYKTNEIEDYTFLSTNEPQQNEATARMATLQLDFNARESLASRWSNKWAMNTGKGHKRNQRVLVQCNCGYDHRAAGHKKRLNAVNFTGCLAHAEITYLVSTQKILRIRGYFIHNEECKEAVIARFPSVPLCQSQNFEDELTQGTAPAIRSLTEKAAVAAEDALRESEDAFLDDLEPVSMTNESTDETEEGNNGGNDEESNNDRVKTDTPDDNDEFDRSDMISIQATSKGAFDEQTIARVFYELEGVTPKVGELTTYLRQCRTLPDQGSRTRAVVFAHAVGSLQNELFKLRLAGHSQSGHAARLPLPTPPSTSSLESRGVKRTIVDLAGASPEKGSKRKPSYRPH